MSKLLLLLKSRTAWTILVLFLVNGITGIREFITPEWLPLVDGALGVLALYFRANIKAK